MAELSRQGMVKGVMLSVWVGNGVCLAILHWMLRDSYSFIHYPFVGQPLLQGAKLKAEKTKMNSTGTPSSGRSPPREGQ